MKVPFRLLALAASALLPAGIVHAQTAVSSPIAGVWQGSATIGDGAQIPVTIRISGSGASLKLALLNGPASHPDESPASSVEFDGTHLIAAYDYFARKLDATLSGNTLTGTYGPAKPGSGGAQTPFTVSRVPHASDPHAVPGAPDIRGSWEIATTSAKGEVAWEFRVDPPTGPTPVIKTVIQRIDGDTGGLWGVWNGTIYTVGHLNASGAALYSIAPQPDGTLLIKNLAAAPAANVQHSAGDVPVSAAAAAPPVRPSEYIARRADDARAHNLSKPTDSTQQTSVKDPSVPFAFSFPDLAGKTVANTDPEFHGKVVIVAVGGSWCPNCHDEAPLLVSLYNKYHSKGLNIVGLDFEQGDPDTDVPRLKAFIAHYAIPYPMLTAGTTDELAEKIPQGVNLNCWPTSFFLGRDGRVREVHAGFAGPGNTAGHAALVREVTDLVEKLLAEPPPSAAGL